MVGLIFRKKVAIPKQKRKLNKLAIPTFAAIINNRWKALHLANNHLAKKISRQHRKRDDSNFYFILMDFWIICTVYNCLIHGLKR